MTTPDLQKTLTLLTLITAGIVRAQAMTSASGAEKRQEVLDLVTTVEAGTDLFVPGVLNHPRVESAVGHVIDAIADLTHAHAEESIANAPAPVPLAPVDLDAEPTTDSQR